MIDWDKPLELKIWDDSYGITDWTDVTEIGEIKYDYAEKPFRKVRFNYDGIGSCSWFCAIDGRLLANDTEGKQFGLVRNKKTPQGDDVNCKLEYRSTGDSRPSITIYGKLTTFDKDVANLLTTDDMPQHTSPMFTIPDTSVNKPMPKKLSKDFTLEHRDGATYTNLNYKHDKHDMVIYYTDLSDSVKVTGWEGIMSYVELLKNPDIYEQYVDKTPSFMSHSKNPYLCIYTNNGCIDINRGDIIKKETFYEYIKLIKQSADRLHEIRHNKKLKVVI